MRQGRRRAGCGWCTRLVEGCTHADQATARRGTDAMHDNWPMPKRRLMLLDTASLYFRAFYGVPTSVTAPDGTPVNAVRGLLDFISRLVTDHAPTDLIAAWDDDWRQSFGCLRSRAIRRTVSRRRLPRARRRIGS